VDPLAERPLFLYLALVLVTVFLPTARARALGSAGLLVSALGISADRVGVADSGGGFATVNQILIGAGALLVLFAALRAWRDRGREAGAAGERGTGPSVDLLLFAGLLFAAFGAHLILVAAGTFLALVSAAAAVLRSRRPRWIVVVAPSAMLLGAGFFLLFAIVGQGGGRMSEIAAGPFSPPAERLLAILLGLGSLTLAGLFPFHHAPWRLSLSPIAMILLARVLVPALPEGLGDWQAPAMLWLAVAVAGAALSGRWAAAMVAGGLLGIWSGRPEGVDPGRALLLFGWLADAGVLPLRWRFGGGAERWAGVWFMPAAAAIPFVLGAALRAQVLVTVLAVLAAVVGLGFESRRRARAG
jgi:hypothetical protein